MRIAKPKEEMIRRIYQKDMIRKKTTQTSLPNLKKKHNNLFKSQVKAFSNYTKVFSLKNLTFAF